MFAPQSVNMNKQIVSTIPIPYSINVPETK